MPGERWIIEEEARRLCACKACSGIAAERFFPCFAAVIEKGIRAGLEKAAAIVADVEPIEEFGWAGEIYEDARATIAACEAAIRALLK